jgi:hypothetical protein
MKRHAHLLAVAAGLLCLANAAPASTLTFATFADPSGNSANPLFWMTQDQVSAEYSGQGLTLQIPFISTTPTSFVDVTFKMDEIAVVNGVTGPGSIEFLDADGLWLLTITFQKATLSEFAFGARNKPADPENVDIIYRGFPSGFDLTEESFAFSFTNFVDYPSGLTTTTASFTSAAIPEPATLAFLGLGCLAMIRLRRR